MYKNFIMKSRLFLIVFVSLFTITACGQSASPITTEPTVTPEVKLAPDIDLTIELPKGDPESGEYLSQVRYFCNNCHVLDDEDRPNRAPKFAAVDELPFILERGDIRIQLPDYGGNASTNREYIIESIMYPEVYVVSGEWEEPMPTRYRYRMSDQDLADILAWMETLK